MQVPCVGVQDPVVPPQTILLLPESLYPELQVILQFPPCAVVEFAHVADPPEMAIAGQVAEIKRQKTAKPHFLTYYNMRHGFDSTRL